MHLLSHKSPVGPHVRSIFIPCGLLLASFPLACSIAAIMDKVDVEKTIEINHFERTISEDSLETANDARINALTPEEQKKLIWKIDCRLVLTLGFMYCVSLMDRYVLYTHNSRCIC